MTDSIEERFYALLPQLYRGRDYLQGQPLRALLAVLEGEYQALKADMEATYDNWFVDTCDQWVLPYAADLVGLRGFSHDQNLFPTQRRLVANALGYRRRKGTAAVLEHVLRDVSGWDVRVVEFFQLLSVTQHLANIRPNAGRSVDLRDTLALSQADGAFERFAHTLDVRGNGDAPAAFWPDANVQQSKYHPDTLGIFIWRLGAYPLDDTFARPISGLAHKGCFTFDAAGRSVPLFNRPQAVDGILDRSEAPNLAIPLTRTRLAFDLSTHVARDPGEVNIQTPRGTAVTPNESLQAANSTYYGPDRSFFISYRTGQDTTFRAVRPEDLAVADLADWQTPLGEQAEMTCGSKVVAVDPELGRMKFLGWQVPKDVRDVIVSYTYGFSADLGGGSYSRYDALQVLDNLPEHAFRISVAEGGRGKLLPNDARVPSIQTALAAWEQYPVRTLQIALAAWERYCATCATSAKRPIGVILILDNGRYGGSSRSTGEGADDSGSDLVIPLPSGAQLSIIAADGKRPSIRPFNKIRITTTLEPAQRKTLGLLQAARPVAEPVALDRRLELNGLLVEGRPIEINDDQIEGFLDLYLKHCTLLESGIKVSPSFLNSQALRIQIENSIVGPLLLPHDLFELVVRDSILDPGDHGYALTGAAPGEAGPVTTLERVTILGATYVSELKLASDVIFTHPVQVVRCERGLMRRSYLPIEGSVTPRREHCQPDMTLQRSEQSVAQTDTIAVSIEAHNEQVRRHIRPRFTSTDPGHPGYAQLHPLTPPEIRGGGQAGAEMGAFHNLYQFQREANLRRALEEYLPLGKQVSVHFVT